MSNAEHIQEIKLYGVNHGFSKSGLFGLEYYDVAPPDGLLDHYSIGHDTLVGIEATEAMSLCPTKYDEEDPRFFELKSDRFFRLACQTLRTAGVPMAFLDDIRLTRHVMPDIAERLAIIRGRDYIQGGLSLRDKQSQGYMGSLIAMMNAQLREPIMFQNMANAMPNVVMLGQAHADVLAASLNLQDKYGVRVVDYAHILPLANEGKLPQVSAPGFESYERVVPSYIKVPTDDEVIALAKGNEGVVEQARRCFNAFSVGRVLARKEVSPDFLGRFYISNTAAHSLFEMTYTERQGNYFNGEIKDVFGDAVVEGEFGNSGVEFCKRYVRSLDGSDLPQWVYRGNIDDATDIITGRYGMTRESAGYGKCFVMMPYNEFPRRSTIKRLDSRPEWDPEGRDVFRVGD